MNRKGGAFVSDLWMVDWRNGARVVACRAPWERNTVGQSLLELLSQEETERLSSTLLSYEMKPIVTETSEGQILIVLPSLMPSSTMAPVLVPALDRQMLLRFLLKRSGIAFDWNESLFAEASGRIPGKVAAHKEALEALVWEIQALDFSTLAPSRRGAQMKFERFLKKRCKVLSLLAGCELRWDTTEPMIDSESFDFGMFSSFLLITLLICRTTALDRAASLGWENDTVRVRFLRDDISDDFVWGREAIDACTEMRQMNFGIESIDDYIQFSMRPRRLEFSYLGIKAEFPFL